MAPLVRELSEDGVQGQRDGAVHDRAGRADHRGGQGRRSVATSRCSPAASPTPASTRCRSWRESVDIMLDGAAVRADLGLARARSSTSCRPTQVGCHIITMTHDLLAKLDLLGKDLDAVLARDRADVPARRDRRRASRSRPMQRACITGGAGFIGSTLADRLSGDGVEVVDRRRLPHRPARVRRGRCSSTPASSSSRATCSTGDAARARVRGLRLGLPPAGQRRRAPRARAPAQRPRAEHDRHLRPCSRRCAPPDVPTDRVLLDRLGLRRARGLPDAGGLRRFPSRRRSTPRRSWPARA